MIGTVSVGAVYDVDKYVDGRVAKSRSILNKSVALGIGSVLHGELGEVWQ